MFLRHNTAGSHCDAGVLNGPNDDPSMSEGRVEPARPFCLANVVPTSAAERAEPPSSIVHKRLHRGICVSPELDKASVMRCRATPVTTLLIDLRLPKLRRCEVDQVGDNSLTLRCIPAKRFLIAAQLT